MSKKSLQKQIQSKLNKLQELIEEITEAQAINSDDPETWDSDTLYSLVEDCQEIIRLLEDQLIKGKCDEFGQPLTEDGLCSLIDTYHEKKDDD